MAEGELELFGNDPDPNRGGACPVEIVFVEVDGRKIPQIVSFCGIRISPMTVEELKALKEDK